MGVFRSFGARRDATRGTAPVETRKDLAGLFLPTTEAGRIGVVPGVLPAASSMIVGTGAFAYLVRGFHAVTTRGSADGVHLWGNDGDVTLWAADDGSSLAAPGSGLSRIDIVYALHPAAGDNADTSSEPVLGVRKGAAASVPVAPSLPTGGLELGRNTMTSAATSTSSGGNTITQSFQRTALRGTPVVVRDDAEALYMATVAQAFAGSPLMVWHIGRSRYEYTTNSGSTWTPLSGTGLLVSYQSSAQVDLGTTLATVVTGTVPVVTGRTYRVFGYTEGTQVTSAGTALVRVRITPAGGGDLDIDQVVYGALSAGSAAAGSASPVYTATATGLVTVSLIGRSSAGAFRVVAGAGRISVEDVTR